MLLKLVCGTGADSRRDASSLRERPPLTFPARARLRDALVEAAIAFKEVTPASSPRRECVKGLSERGSVRGQLHESLCHLTRQRQSADAGTCSATNGSRFGPASLGSDVLAARDRLQSTSLRIVIVQKLFDTLDLSRGEPHQAPCTLQLLSGFARERVQVARLWNSPKIGEQSRSPI